MSRLGPTRDDCSGTAVPWEARSGQLSCTVSNDSRQMPKKSMLALYQDAMNLGTLALSGSVLALAPVDMSAYVSLHV